MTRRKKELVGELVAGILILAVVALILWPLVARADERQDWIHEFHKDCCPHNRCFPVKAEPSLHFWNVEGYHSIVPLGHERRWHFRETYGCAYETAPTVIRCLFRPAPEAS